MHHPHSHQYGHNHNHNRRITADMTSKRPYPNQDQDHQQQEQEQEQQQQQQPQQDHQNDQDNDTPKRRLGKVDRGREACNECRRHKIRCHPHPDDPQHLFPCSRCERMNLSCEFAKHNRGRKRKRPLPLLAGTTVSEDQHNSIPAQSSSSVPLPSSNHKSKLPKQEDNQPHSFGDPRFPFISNGPDTHSHSRSSHHARIEDDFRPSKGIMSLRHMVGEESSEDVSSEEGDDGVDQAADNSARLGDSTGKKSSNKGKTPTRGPELVDDPIRAGFVDEVEARALFHLFMTHYNGGLPMLDPAIHTHDVVREQSPFLYTAILCVTSRYLSSLSPNTTDGPNMSPESAQSVHQQILVLARDHMTWTFAEAITSIDVVRAMLILTINKEPDDDKAGFHMNRAILAGRELDLGRIPSVAEMSGMNEEDHRRLRMRQRVWLCLFFANSIFNMQFQQPMLISQSDPLVATAHHWLKRARPDTVLRDTHLVCSVELRRKFLNYRDLLVGSIPNEPTYASPLSLSMLTRTMNQDWDISCEAWIRDIIDVGGTSNNINKPRVWTAALRLNLNLLIVNQTLRLLPQDQIDVGSPSSIPAFNHCLNAATTVLLRIETLDKTQLTFASDTFLHFALYAATLLSTLCRGQHPYKFEAPEIEHCRRLITKVANALDAASAYPSDSPTLHAWYLRRLCQLLPPPTTTPIPSGPPLSVSSSDAPLPPPTNIPTSNPIIDPLLQNVTTTMPVDPALTTVIGNELDFFLGDFPWVGLGLDATIGMSNSQLGQSQNSGTTWDNNSTSNNNDLIGMFGNAHTHTLANGYGGANHMGLTHNDQPGSNHGGNLDAYSNTHRPLPLEIPYGSGGGLGGPMGMGMGMSTGGMAFSHVV